MNECIQQGIFPDVLKIARVTPLHKGGDITPNNYRPISNLNKISKIFEKIVHNRLMNFFLKYKILSNKQFSYRKNHSAVDVLAIILDYIYSKLNSSENVIGIFIDLSKAFAKSIFNS